MKAASFIKIAFFINKSKRDLRVKVCCATVEVLHRTSTVGRSKAPSLPIKALSFCRPTELRAERWYAVPKGETAQAVRR